MKSTGLEDLIEMCFKNGLFTDSEKKDANKIRITVNKILHRGATISKEEAYDYIKKTYRIIETLYTEHQKIILIHNIFTSFLNFG